MFSCRLLKLWAGMSFLRKQESSDQRDRMIKNYYVYMLASKKNGTLYIGVTSNLGKRIYEHKHKLIGGFTKKYNVDRLVYYEITEDVESAILREKRLKKWKRQWKVELIEQKNPNWNDLYCDII
jgi:putative endonuclease